jgi:hypothetical protein
MISGSTCNELMETLGIAIVDILFEFCEGSSSRIDKPTLIGSRSKKARGLKHGKQ